MRHDGRNDQDAILLPEELMNKYVYHERTTSWCSKSVVASPPSLSGRVSVRIASNFKIQINPPSPFFSLAPIPQLLKS